MEKKAVIGGVTAVVLVAAVVAVIAVVGTKNDSGSSDGELSSTSKSVSALCAATDYKESCEQTLTKAINGSSVDPKDVIHALVSATIEQVKAAMESSGNLTVKITDSLNKMSMADCKKLFDVATDRLNAVLEVARTEPDWMSKRADDINTWLSAVIAYSTSCTDDFNDAEVKSAMEKAVAGAIEFSSNALALFKQFTSVLNDLDDVDVSLNVTAPEKRRLLAYPSWLSGGDRKLMAARGGRGGGAVPQAKPNVVVAKDGTGQFNSINAAVAAAPAKSAVRYVIHVKAGVYNEQVLVDKPNIFMYGDGSRKTIVTGSKSVAKSGVNTKNTATFAVEAPGFVATNMGFSNTAGPEGEQAVALRVMGDRAAFFNCRMDAYQDTLYVQGERQFYRNCVVSGTVDFIFGDSAAVLQNCLIIVRNPGKGQQNMVTAQGRKSRMETTGIVIQNCRIVPEQRLFAERLTIPTYLGRPWKAFSRTIVMESQLGDLIRPEGWSPWQGEPGFVNTLYYAEYNNRGPGANTASRVKWPGYHIIDRQTAQPFTPGVFIDRDNWITSTGARYIRGFKSR